MNRAKQILQDKTGSRSSIDVCTKYAALEAMKQIAWEAWKHVTDQYETHSINKELERIEFEKWYNKQIEP